MTFCNILKYILHPRQVWDRFMPWLVRPRRMIYVFGSPGHSNLGDKAQTYCIEKWLRQNYPEYGIKIFTLASSTPELIADMRRFIREKDMLICHSGYHMTDLYDERLPYMKLAKNFKDRKIVIFPQTFHFKDKAKLIETANTFNNHGDVVIMCRDEVSYEIAQQYFNKCKLFLMPDIVTSLIGTIRFSNKRNGILFCMRNDVEAFYTKDQINNLRDRFKGIDTEITDTTLSIPWQSIAANREEILYQIIELYSKYKVVITDRYHGTIISLIAGTPVVVLSSVDHKLSSGVKWFPKEYSEYVYYAQNLDEAYRIVNLIIAKKDSLPQLSPYFKTNYYDSLKAKLSE